MATPSLLRPTMRASSAKEVAKSGATSLPSCYISRNPLSASAAAEADDKELEVELQIPTIDFSLLKRGNDGLRAQIVRDLACACEDWGFFSVVNHGVPAALRMAVMDASVGFFDLREEEKAEYEGRHVMDPIRCGTSFNSTVEDVRYWRDFFKVFVHPKFHSPSKPLAFREVCEDYARHTRQLAKELLKAIWEGLGLEEDYIEKAIGLHSCFQVVVGNLYPPCPEPELAWGLPAHSDHGLLTILMQNDTDGLQVMHHGQWVSVKPIPNSFLVNVGDHMESFMVLLDAVDNQQWKI
ncbi:hypothetical protein HPP92_002314 [Vanilla planifolia]|uniref:Fe2OG dioxygenase domain-containing protein n=1 Tax=Vanilla planifolia TaxID=51239 RepID=A0A835RVM8_VANPL|nr:hypothetical protein HPP92_002314 [Vanilla planifolia]